MADRIIDRRDEGPPALDFGRALDPTPLAKSIYPQYLPPESYRSTDLDPRYDRPSPLGNQLGYSDLARAQALSTLSALLRLAGHKSYENMHQ